MKIFNRLSLAILLMGATLIVFSYIPDMDMWKETFSYKIHKGWECGGFPSHAPIEKDEGYNHWHWNYKGWIWFLTGMALFIVQVIRVVFIFKDKDFNN